MPAQESDIYKNTKKYLYSRSSEGLPIAQVGCALYHLNENLQLCSRGAPWTLNTEGDWYEYHDIITLPLHAAKVAHLHLQAMESSSTRLLTWRQFTFQVTCDPDKLERALINIKKFLQHLEGVPINKMKGKEMEKMNDEAKKLKEKLDSLFIVEMNAPTDFPITFILAKMVSQEVRSSPVKDRLGWSFRYKTFTRRPDPIAKILLFVTAMSVAFSCCMLGYILSG